MQYMQSPSWRKIRQKRLEKDKFRCQNIHVIGGKQGLEVHHKSYVRLGNERLSDLITLCRRCHNDIHKRK